MYLVWNTSLGEKIGEDMTNTQWRLAYTKGGPMTLYSGSTVIGSGVLIPGYHVLQDQNAPELQTNDAAYHLGSFEVANEDGSNVETIQVADLERVQGYYYYPKAAPFRLKVKSGYEVNGSETSGTWQTVQAAAFIDKIYEEW